MIQYFETREGSYTLDGMTIPAVDDNRHYREMQELIAAGEAEIVPFNHAAADAADVVLAEQTWVKSELDRSDIVVNKFEDGFARNMTGNVNQWRQYRNALRDYVIGGVVQGGRPAEPDA